ncbi:YitT family protein [Hymenobacter metallicola]|uniref:YitT family protein n=1 Tax=Hymenobacter metallicola TaxID=2563114 RepID=A0A4Z0QHU3_9BACT|nr:YitT family protein [Hymenobacter metallicola]TGE29648.1 YitT family protein [Hymenobacter metallicola]
MLIPQLIMLDKLRKQPRSTPPRRRRRPPRALAALRNRRLWRRQLTNVAFLIAGIFSAALGLKGFLLPNGFIDGGVTGISLLIARVFGLPLPLLIVLINIPFVVLGYFQIDRLFAFKTLLTILGLAGVLVVVSFPILTQDKLLISVFGGFFLGAGIGLAMRGGGVLDGTEILAVYLSKKTSLTIGDIILGLNILIFVVAAVVLSFETALYSILAYLAASKTIDFIIDGIEEYTGVTIVSGRSDAIRRMITEKLGRGATVYSGKRGYGVRGELPQAVDIVFTVITRLELGRLTDEVEKIDRSAFLVMHSVKETKGGVIKKRPLH